MRKRRKARLRKTNRWIVRGHGDEQEDQEEGDVSENRMLTFRDPQNQRSSARRRGKRFAPSGPLYLLFLPLQPQARRKLVQIHITHWRWKQRKRAWDHGFCHITKGRSWEFNGYQAYIKPSKESGKYFFSTEKLQVVQKDFKTHLPITFKLCLFGTSNVCRESALKKTMILSTERVSIESECSLELSACREVSINQPSKDKMFFGILRMSTESKYPYATLFEPCTHPNRKQFCICPSYFQPPLVKAGRAL